MTRHSYLESGLSFGPVIFRRLIERIDPSRYDERLASDRFNLREVAAHLADLEPVMRGRMQFALSNPGSEIQNFDQDAEAIAKGYATWDMADSLAKFAQERRQTVELFSSLSEADRAKTIKHPVMGEISVLEIAVFALGHDAYHIEQATEY